MLIYAGYFDNISICGSNIKALVRFLQYTVDFLATKSKIPGSVAVLLSLN
jgi:hypothetical protein